MNVENEFELKAAALEIWNGLIGSLGNLAPRLLVALAVVVLGYAAAKVVEFVVRSSLKRVRFDALTERVGITAGLARLGATKPPSALVALVLYYVLLILIFQAALDVLGLQTVADALGTFVGFVPNIIAALVILLLGSAVGRIAGRVASESAANVGASFAQAIGRAVYMVILVVFALMAMSQLEINTSAIQIVSVVLLSGFALAMAFSFGFGTRDITRNIIAGFYSKKLYHAGDEVEIRGQKVVIKAITPIQTILERDDRIVPISNWAFLKEQE